MGRQKDKLTQKMILYMAQDYKCKRCHEKFALEELTFHHDIKGKNTYKVLLCKKCHDKLEPFRIPLSTINDILKRKSIDEDIRKFVSSINQLLFRHRKQIEFKTGHHRHIARGFRLTKKIWNNQRESILNQSRQQIALVCRDQIYNIPLDDLIEVSPRYSAWMTPDRNDSHYT